MLILVGQLLYSGGLIALWKTWSELLAANAHVYIRLLTL
jgi:hypothetical protein